MHPPHCTITPTVVRSTASKILTKALPWKAYGRRVTVRCLIDLLLLVASLRSSLSAVARLFGFGFSPETARKALHANLPEVPALTQSLVDSLYAFGLSGRNFRRRKWVVAIDEHKSCFYGDHDTPGIVGGQKKQGTKYFYGYATAALVHHRHRYVVGLIALDGSLKPHQVVATLMEQMTSRRLRLRGVVLDSGFDSGDTLLLLQEANLAYTVPLRRKGSGSNRRNECFSHPVGTLEEVSWTTEDSRRKVTTKAVVIRRSKTEEVKVYAYGGWEAVDAKGAARMAKKWYRKRFGIETSYRQMNEGKGRTTAKDVAYRLLLVGLALLLRQIWVWLSGQVAADRGLKPSAWVEALPLRRMLDWLRQILRSQYNEEEAVHLGRPLWPLSVA